MKFIFALLFKCACCINNLVKYKCIKSYILNIPFSHLSLRYNSLRGSIDIYTQSRFQTFARRKRSSVKKKKKDEVVENTLFARIYFNTRVRSTSDARRRDALTSAV